jgi:two-component system NtrC family sensor kinase
MASIGQLAAGVAHEINNPTGFIMSNLGSLQNYAAKLSDFIKIQDEAVEDISRSSKEDLHTILDRVKERRRALKVDYVIADLGNLVKESIDGAERIKNIVQALKCFSRANDTEFKISNINAGIESTLNIVWNELKYKATVKKEYGDIPLTKCNLSQLNQVFMNLLVNASHAIEKAGVIAIRTWSDDAHIHISISDTGCGIPQENINKIFDPFFTTKEIGKGTGLGMSIAYEIVKNHKGELHVQSELGKGTVFTLQIPIMRS